MVSEKFLDIQPHELKFPFELKKSSSCCLQLTNPTDHYIAFKVKTTNPKGYCVRPNTGVVLPGTTCDVTVTMQAHKEAPPDMQCKDKFLLQSVIVNEDTKTKDITSEMFSRVDGKIVHDVKLKVLHVRAYCPSPVPEGSEEGSPHRISQTENGKSVALSDAVSRSFEDSSEKKSESWAIISKLNEEKSVAIQQTQKLQQELEFLRKESRKAHGNGFSLIVVILIGILGLLIGYLI